MSEPSSVPRRELRDPGVLRALSHPLRLTLLEELANLGQATATELAERIGESPANCSWHLRQLAKYDLIEEGTGGTGRQRPWRWINESIGVADQSDDDEPEFTQARDALLDVLMSREVNAWRTWQATESRAPKQWSDASFGEVSLHWMTVEELAEFKADIRAVVDQHILSRLDRADPARRPADARPVRFIAWSIPSGRPDELPPSNPPPPEEEQ
jgi:DNA-binding transcriptional ArsR family regulator